jgi:predicted HTH domain antitoxin
MSATTELTVELPENVSREEAQLALAVRLFQQGKVSLGQAAAIAAQSKRAFIDTLGREGVPVVNYPADELRGELRG